MNGVNCRHSFSPYFPGISIPRWSEETLKQYAEKVVRYNDRDIPYYEATQMLRGMERRMRDLKKDEALTKAAGLDDKAAAFKKKVRAQSARINDFCSQTGLRRQYQRERIAK